MTVSLPTATLVEQVFKSVNITLVGDGLITGPLAGNLFTNLGVPKTSMIVAQVGMVDFGTYSFVVQPDQRRAVAKDQSKSLDVTSPIVDMQRTYLQQLTTPKIKAVGFNFLFELTFADSVLSFLSGTLFNASALARLQGPIEAAGAKFVLSRSDHALTMNLDPVWRVPNKANLGLNYHLDVTEDRSPGEILNRYSQLCADASNSAYSLLRVGEK